MLARGSFTGSCSSRRDPHCVSAPAGANPPPAAPPASAEPKTQLLRLTASSWEREEPPALGSCQGLVISSKDVSELLGASGLAREITELHRIPIPPCLAI